MKTIRLIRGDDPILVSEAVTKAIDELVGDADRSLVLEELTESNYQHDDGNDLRALVDACGTPPFLTDYRVVVGREMGSFTKAADVASLVSYLESPLDTTRLLLVYEKAPSGSRIRNKRVSSEINTRVRQAEAAGAEGAENTEELAKMAIKRIDMAVAKGKMHKNTAARKKSRLLKRVRSN